MIWLQRRLKDVLDNVVRKRQQHLGIAFPVAEIEKISMKASAFKGNERALVDLLVIEFEALEARLISDRAA